MDRSRMGRGRVVLRVAEMVWADFSDAAQDRRGMRRVDGVLGGGASERNSRVGDVIAGDPLRADDLAGIRAGRSQPCADISVLWLTPAVSRTSEEGATLA